MLESVATAAITGVVTLIVCLINNHTQQEKTRTLIEYKLDELSKRVDKHNSVIERTYNLEKEYEVQEEKIESVNHRLDVLEKSE